MSKPFDLLLGRRTYEIFAAHWPYQNDAIGEIFNRINKYVVATTPIDTSWKNSILINKDVIDQYAVSMESQRVWITMNAKTKKEVEKALEKSPLYKFWTYEIDELFVLDGQHYRLPAVQPN